MYLGLETKLSGKPRVRQRPKQRSDEEMKATGISDAGKGNSDVRRREAFLLAQKS